MIPSDGRKRVFIEEVKPQIDSGRHPVCRIIGDDLTVTAAVFADGHDRLAAQLLYRPKSERRWHSVPMTPLVNDVWTASFKLDQLGSWRFTIQAWIDHFETWASDLKKRLAAQTDLSKSPSNRSQSDAGGQDIPLTLRTGASLIRVAAQRAKKTDAKHLLETAVSLESLAAINSDFYEYPLDEDVHALMSLYPDLTHASRFAPELPVQVERDRARFSAWYEIFPRSASPVPGQHGTFRDVERQLPEIAGMGFDILYLPPIHPIGHAFRKGRNNSTTPSPDDPGSPWAIGNKAAVKDDANQGTDHGGHKSIHPQLGTLEDFNHLVATASTHGLEIALDIAFQCSPDHPWVTEHPDWFVIRPDGTIQYAENPPKKYQDIYPLNFESPDWQALWRELYSVFEFWIQRGVHVFRVDNPHTKALTFWEWCIGELREKYPDTIFLAEAFTRPHVMYALAKIGFTQSYTYFTWRNSKAELQEYLEEITRPPISDFFQPNFWPNTPDILHKSLQDGGRPAFMQRFILAATLAANYGIYGPAYELCENTPAHPSPGKAESEEYDSSEKYEIRQRDRNTAGSLVPLITSLNTIRRTHLALHSNLSLHFHSTENPNLLCYSKSTPSFENAILVAINLDPFHVHDGWVDLDLDRIGIEPNQDFFVDDLLTSTRYTWHGPRNYVRLNPEFQPAHVFLVGNKSKNQAESGSENADVVRS
jgi:starch synthase (maltosyl-transferring)